MPDDTADGAAWRDGAAGSTVDSLTADRPLIVVSNREPYEHDYDGDEVSVSRPAGGLTAALDPLMQSVSGTWVAWGSGDADRDTVDEHDRVGVPPEDPSYTLRRVWLSDDLVSSYYYGYSNQVLWPLAHGMPTKLTYEEAFWEGYREANVTFADVVVEEIEATAEDIDPIVWFQDYHFGLAPALVRRRRTDAFLMHFWHIPWPSWDIFRRAPHHHEVLDSLLANDLVAFHTDRDREHFVECAREAMDATYDPTIGALDAGGVTAVRTHPIGIDANEQAARARSDDAERFWAEFSAEHGLADRQLLVGVDRLDYTKGINERLTALERFLEDHPERHGDVVLVQKGSESRSRIDEYRAVQRQVSESVERINRRFGTDEWTPVIYLTDYLPMAGLAALYRHADVALVSSLRDGMNLVAKEYVASQVEDPGVLVLSHFAGASGELGDGALTVNPVDTATFARLIERALTMPVGERERRMDSLRRRVHAADSYQWINDQFEVVARLLETS